MCFRKLLILSWIALFILSSLVLPFRSEMNWLPAPENISMNSINMNHILMWSPVRVPAVDVSYSVEAQGEYEQNYMPDSWVPLCSSINATWCNVTDYIADVCYDLRVRAELQNITSDWSAIIEFHRKHTQLTTPNVTVKSEEGALLAKFDDLKIPFPKVSNVLYILYYWKKGNEDLVHNMTITAEQYSMRLSDTEEGEEYCFQGQTYVDMIKKASNYSQITCITTSTSAGPVWIVSGVIAVLCLLTMFFALLYISVLLKKMCQLLKYSCCPQIDMPNALTIDILPLERTVLKSQKNENCEAVYVFSHKTYFEM